MPLPAPVDRQPIHRRTIECHGYRRGDGLWDIEGHIVDTKAYPFTNMDRGLIQPGEPLHEMWLRLTIDNERVIHDVEAATDASPFRICPDVTPRFKDLIGLKIGPGFKKKVLEKLGGTKGCTHLVELLGPIGTVAIQTHAILSKEREAQREPGQKPWLIDTCYGWSSSNEPVKKRWPEFYTGPDKAAE
jgi:hypothetical protein